MHRFRNLRRERTCNWRARESLPIVQLAGGEYVAEVRVGGEHDQHAERGVQGDLVAARLADLHQNRVQVDVQIGARRFRLHYVWLLAAVHVLVWWSS